MTRHAGRRGFTLVSVMVSAVIVGIALAAAASAFIGAGRLTRQAAQFTVASNFAEGVMEEVRTRPFARIASADVKSGLPKLPGARCAVAVTSREAGLKEVTVTCRWDEPGRARGVRLSTLVAKGGTR